MKWLRFHRDSIQLCVYLVDVRFRWYGFKLWPWHFINFKQVYYRNKYEIKYGITDFGYTGFAMRHLSDGRRIVSSKKLDKYGFLSDIERDKLRESVKDKMRSISENE